MFSPEERQRAVDLYSATPMTTAQAVEHLGHPTRQCPERRPAKDPGHAGHMARPIVPPETGARRSNRCRAACGGSGPPNCSARASAGQSLGQGVSRGRHGRVAARERERRPGRQAGGAAGSGRRRHGGPAPQGRGAGTGGGAVMREVVEVAGKDPGAGLRRLSDRGRTLLIDRLGPACSPGSMTCLPGIAPGGRLLPPRRARG